MRPDCVFPKKGISVVCCFYSQMSLPEGFAHLAIETYVPHRMPQSHRYEKSEPYEMTRLLCEESRREGINHYMR